MGESAPRRTTPVWTFAFSDPLRESSTSGGGEFMKFDAVVIGSGQGGNPLCHRLADKGWNVALVERSHLGGTCINTGCTPTKTMVASAQVAHYARNASRWGVH